MARCLTAGEIPINAYFHFQGMKWVYVKLTETHCARLEVAREEDVRRALALWPHGDPPRLTTEELLKNPQKSGAYYATRDIHTFEDLIKGSLAATKRPWHKRRVFVLRDKSATELEVR